MSPPSTPSFFTLQYCNGTYASALTRHRFSLSTRFSLHVLTTAALRTNSAPLLTIQIIACLEVGSGSIFSSEIDILALTFGRGPSSGFTALAGRMKLMKP